MAFWLIKAEPSAYGWDRLVKEKGTVWDGVRNYQARNNLQAMKKGDLCLFYHSVKDKEIVGVARVTREAYPDPTTEDRRWAAVDIVPQHPLERPVSLATLKSTPATSGMALIRQGRLSVCPVTSREYKAVLKLGGS